MLAAAICEHLLRTGLVLGTLSGPTYQSFMATLRSGQYDKPHCPAKDAGHRTWRNWLTKVGVLGVELSQSGSIAWLATTSLGTFMGRGHLEEGTECLCLSAWGHQIHDALAMSHCSTVPGHCTLLGQDRKTRWPRGWHTQPCSRDIWGIFEIQKMTIHQREHSTPTEAFFRN